MATTLFLALQCFECSTMQVKQKKKSSNKWVCVVCNQKQSVKKVFAQGYKAKELRCFVQSFNMSRKVADEEEEQGFTDTYTEVNDEGEIDEDASDVRGKKRSDWSEYLDYDSINDERRLPGEEDEDDLKIVTEMPNEMFKRPKLNTFSNGGESSSVKQSGKKDSSNELTKLSFYKCIIKEPDFRSDGVMAREKDTEKRNLKPERVCNPGSKWDTYLNNDEEEYKGRETLKDDHVEEGDRAIMEMSSDYQIVDDEVHPDFM